MASNMHDVPYPQEVRLALRLPGSLHARLVRAADRDRRSINSEIVFLLLVGVAQAELRQDAEERMLRLGEDGGSHRAQ
jgi:hypothetical protein